ncbi:MAG: DUF11 domain-containing protein [Gemmatimonadota bacterium]|nr:DUF11 domain-containing protein [Gemmatimonadota bacterium]
MTFRPFAALLLGCTAAALTSCVDRGAPLAPESMEGIARLAIIPAPAAATQLPLPGPIAGIRVTVKAPVGGVDSVLYRATEPVDPAAPQWALDAAVPIPLGGEPVTVAVELLSGATGADVVEWSGASRPFQLREDQVVRVTDIVLYRGPLDNLAVTGLTVSPARAQVFENRTLVLTAAAAPLPAGLTPRFYWTALDSTAMVDGSGIVTGLIPGVARVVAEAGSAADTAVLSVVPLPTADVDLVKRAAPASAQFGAVVTYDLVVTNFGPDAITGLAVTDVLPAGLTFQGAKPGVGTYDPATGVWTVGALGVDFIASLSITAVVTTPQVGITLTNQAWISALDAVDLNAQNDTSRAVVTIP